MSYFESFIYGLIQGITEFLPISSSGHLALLPKVLKIEDPGVFFDLFMHIGTALSVIIYFRNDLIKLIRSYLNLLLRKKGGEWALNFTVSTIITLSIVLILKEIALNHGRSIFIIGVNLIFFGLLMYLSDKLFPQKKEFSFNKSIHIKESILIGLAQALAIFPGVSRSGVTITMARSLSIGRLEASRYSFLLSLPIILGAALLKLPILFETQKSFDLTSAGIGIGVSFIVGLGAIHFFIELLQRFGMIYFFLYRLILGLLIFLTI